MRKLKPMEKNMNLRTQTSVKVKISSLDLDPNIVSAILDYKPHEVMTQNGSCAWVWVSKEQDKENTGSPHQEMLAETVKVFRNYDNLKIANPDINTSISILVGDISEVQGEENSLLIDSLRQYGDVWLDMPTGSILLNTD